MAGNEIDHGAERHAGIEGETVLECCDTRIAVVRVWEVLDTCLKAPAGMQGAAQTSTHRFILMYSSMRCLEASFHGTLCDRISAGRCSGAPLSSLVAVVRD